MKIKFNVPRRDELDPQGQRLHDAFVGQYGKAPNLLSFAALSPHTLAHHLAAKERNKRTPFTQKEIEAVNLVVSEVMGDQYGLAEHTVWGKLNGLSQDESVEVRMGRHSNPRLHAIIRLAQTIVRTQGRPAAAALEEFFNQGFGNAALVDVVAIIADQLLFNYLHHIVGIDIDFPRAEALPQNSANNKLNQLTKTKTTQL